MVSSGMSRRSSRPFRPMLVWLCLRLHRSHCRETSGNTVLMDRDQRHGLGCGRVAQAFHDARTRQTHAVFGPACSASTNSPSLAPMHRAPSCTSHSCDQSLPCRWAQSDRPRPLCGRYRRSCADWCRCAGSGAPHNCGLRSCTTSGGPECDRLHPAPDRQARGNDQDNAGSTVLRPAIPGDARKRSPSSVRASHLQHADRRQAIRVTIAALALFQMPFGFKLFEHALQVDPIARL